MRWLGPYRAVSQDENSGAYRIKTLDGIEIKNTVAADRIKKFVQDESGWWQSEDDAELLNGKSYIEYDKPEDRPDTPDSSADALPDDQLIALDRRDLHADMGELRADTSPDKQPGRQDTRNKGQDKGNQPTDTIAGQKDTTNVPAPSQDKDQIIPIREDIEISSDDEEGSGTDIGSDDNFEDVLQPNPQPRHHFEVIFPELSRSQKRQYRNIPGL
ncbi:hypothetical protein GGI43DRAFT_387158 [Trichoderma evansii]